VPLAGAAAFAPGGLIAGNGNDSCAWVRISPTLAATANAAHPTKMNWLTPRGTRRLWLFDSLLIRIIR